MARAGRIRKARIRGLDSWKCQINPSDLQQYQIKNAADAPVKSQQTIAKTSHLIYDALKNPAAAICATISLPSGVTEKSWQVRGMIFESVPAVVSPS